MSPQELKVLEKIASNLGKIDESIRDLTDTIKKANSNTSRNTMMYKVVESISEVGDSIDAQVDILKSINKSIDKK